MGDPPDIRDPYEVLQLPKGGESTEQEIKKARFSVNRAHCLLSSYQYQNLSVEDARHLQHAVHRASCLLTSYKYVW